MSALTTKNLLAFIAIAAVAPLAHAGVCDNLTQTYLAAVTRSTAPVTNDCVDVKSSSDSSSHVANSFNTDRSLHAADSFNTKTSVTPIDVRSVTTSNDIAANTNSAYTVGPSVKGGSVGGMSLNASQSGPQVGSHSKVATGNASVINTAVVNRDSNAPITQIGQANSGLGDTVMGDKSAFKGNVTGPAQYNIAGGQQVDQANGLDKRSQDTTTSSNPTQVSN